MFSQKLKDEALDFEWLAAHLDLCLQPVRQRYVGLFWDACRDVGE